MAPLRLRSPIDVLGVVPYLFGFHPANSLVILALRQQSLIAQLRTDLPGRDDVVAHARHCAAVVGRQGVDAAILVGYGPGHAVTPIVMATARQLELRAIVVPEMLRAHDARYWSYRCRNVACCPVDGVPYDVSESEMAAAATYAGAVALPSRADVSRRLDSVSGAARVAMRAATRDARRRLAGLAPEGPGRAAVDRAVRCHRLGTRLADADVAWLSLLLRNPAVGDHARACADADVDHDVPLWTDVTRRAEPELVAAPAALLAYGSWCAGDGVVASIAVDRALTVDPAHPLANLLDRALRCGISSQALRC